MTTLVHPSESKSGEIGLLQGDEPPMSKWLQAYHGGCLTPLEWIRGATRCPSCGAVFERPHLPWLDLDKSAKRAHIRAWASCWLEIPMSQITVHTS